MAPTRRQLNYPISSHLGVWVAQNLYEVNIVHDRSGGIIVRGARLGEMPTDFYLQINPDLSLTGLNGPNLIKLIYRPGSDHEEEIHPGLDLTTKEGINVLVTILKLRGVKWKTNT